MNPQPVDVPTPRTVDAIREELFREVPVTLIVDAGFARQLERELVAATAELERTKEQLRVARRQILCAVETMELCREGLDCGDYDDVDESLANAAYNLKAFTQPQSGAVDPVKGEEG